MMFLSGDLASPAHGAVMTSNIGARLLLLLLGTAFILMGAAGTQWLWRSYEHAAETYRWAPTEARILSSQILTERVTPHSPLSYRAEVRYAYTVNGQKFTSNRIRRVDGASSHRHKAKALVEAYRPGAAATCFVDPATPAVAILQRSSLAALYTLWFPLLFVLGGAGSVWRALWTGRKS
ncbi:MAG: DUF3592 domain-containing protein [Roseimicrobium sp.]